MDLEKVKKRLIVEEGKKHFPYRCSANKITIGVGRNLEDRGVSDITIDQMLDEDIDICVAKLLTFVKTLELLRTSQYDKAADELLRSRYAASLPQRSGRNANMIRDHAN